MKLILIFSALFGVSLCLETFVGLTFGVTPPDPATQPTCGCPSTASKQSKSSWSPIESPTAS
uniref:Uncharacterized protein n=1 Tax=Athene cunicularia TaxID=194338 RepID=A0A663M0P5_ATHCN